MNLDLSKNGICRLEAHEGIEGGCWLDVNLIFFSVLNNDFMRWNVFLLTTKIQIWNIQKSKLIILKHLLPHHFLRKNFKCLISASLWIIHVPNFRHDVFNRPLNHQNNEYNDGLTFFACKTKIFLKMKFMK